MVVPIEIPAVTLINASMFTNQDAVPIETPPCKGIQFFTSHICAVHIPISSYPPYT